MRNFDVAIIGAGVSGSILAKFLPENLKIILIDKKNKNEKKVCGGLLAPEAKKEFAKIGIEIPAKILVNPQIFRLKILDFVSNDEKIFFKDYLNFDRLEFDNFLLEKAVTKKNVLFLPNSIFRKFKKIGKKKFEIEISKNEKVEKLTCKILVAASGSAPFFRNNFSGKIYSAIQKTFQNSENLSEFLAIFDQQVSDFYSWIIPKEKEILLGSAIPAGKNALKKFNILEKKIGKKIKLGKILKTEATRIFRPEKISDISIGSKNFVKIGEAAGLISPSSAEGISFAVSSAKYLSEAISENFDDFFPIFEKKIRKLKLKIFWNLQKSKLMFSNFSRKIIFRSGFFDL